MPPHRVAVLFAALLTIAGSSQLAHRKRRRFDWHEQIEVAVIARDRSGAFVSDLTLADFELYEDGKRQQLNDAVLIDLPIVTAPPSAKVLPLDVATNVQRTDGRTYLLVLDDLHVDPDQTFNVRRAAREFVERTWGRATLRRS